MSARAPKAQGGFTLIEVMVAMIVLLIGLLGFVGLLVRSQQMQMESYQRAQALVLLDAMAERLGTNRGQAANYVTAQPLGTGGAALGDCAALSGANRDLCEWDLLLKGAAETKAGNNAGAMIDARGCVVQVDAANAIYRVTVAWQGLASTAAPPAAVTCGSGAYGDEARRRVMFRTLRMGNLL